MRETDSIDALVLESVYPAIENAVQNRVGMRLGWLKHVVTPLLLWQLRPRLGIQRKDLRPMDGISHLSCPVLIAAGDQDRRTTYSDTQLLFGAANEPKDLLIFEGAGHQDLLAFDSKKYESRVLPFLKSNLLGAEIP